MDSVNLELVKRGVDYARRRKKWVILLAACGFTGYGVYRVYQSPSASKKRERLFRAVGALISFAEAVSESSEVIGLVSKDTKQFLQSESDEIPNSLRQISKITRSEEVSDSLIRSTRALTVGILRGYMLGTKNIDGEIYDNSTIVDQVMDKVFSTGGSGFASVVVGSFARNLVMALFEDGSLNSNDSKIYSGSPPVPGWLSVLCRDQFRELMGDCVQMFVSTAVAVYLDKTMEINTYDEFFQGLTNPKHEEKVRDVVVSVCTGAVETFIRTSHHVLTSSDSNEDSKPFHSYTTIEQGQGLDLGKEDDCGDRDGAPSKESKEENSLNEIKDGGGWVESLLSTLAVPRNRRLILDVTGRVTFETVRSLLEFLLEKLFCCFRESLNVVREAIFDSGVSIARYVTEKSHVIVTVWLSLCLHFLGGTGVLMPAAY